MNEYNEIIPGLSGSKRDPANTKLLYRHFIDFGQS